VNKRVFCVLLCLVLCLMASGLIALDPPDPGDKDARPDLVPESNVVDSFPVPIIDTQSWVDTLCSNDPILIHFESLTEDMQDITGVATFLGVRLEASQSDSFDYLLAPSEESLNSPYSFPVAGRDSLQGWLYFRLRTSAIMLVDYDPYYSTPSNVVSAFLDFSPPVVTTFYLRDQDDQNTTWTDHRLIDVVYEAADVPESGRCEWLWLSEDPDFPEAETEIYSLADNCSGAQVFQLSEDTGTKWVYAKFIDACGHATACDSASCISASIILGEGSHNYPNPFDPEHDELTNIVFRLPENPDEVTVYIYDLFGQLVWKTDNIEEEFGLNTVTWDGKHQNGSPVANGGYICRIEKGGNGFCQHKIAIVKK